MAAALSWPSFDKQWTCSTWLDLRHLRQTVPSVDRCYKIDETCGIFNTVIIRNVRRYVYTLSHRECGQFRPCLHENFEKFEMISTPTGSWIRSRLRRDRIQLPVEVDSVHVCVLRLSEWDGLFCCWPCYDCRGARNRRVRAKGITLHWTEILGQNFRT